MVLEIRNINKFFGPIKALDNVSLTIENGSLVCFLGPSGCGKTTLLRVISGLELPDSGSIIVNEQNMSSIPARNRNFGMVFQSYSLFPNMTIASNIAYGLESRKWTKSDIALRVDNMLNLVHLEDQAHKYPHQLSGGQQQRVALARALAPRPAVLLLDEPLSALDAKVREELREEIKTLQQRLKITTIMVTHDQEEAMTMADKIMVMKDGKVMQTGTPMDIYRRPENPFVAQFIGRMNIVPADLGLDVPSNGSPKGSRPKTLGIRPENIVLYDDPGSEIKLTGIIEQISSLGNLTRVKISLKNRNGQGPLSIVSEIQGSGPDMQIGKEKALAIDPQTIRVLEWA
ncbi:MAG: ABC transporter ATP-binding protein [Desulfonatronovibrio sp.]